MIRRAAAALALMLPLAAQAELPEVEAASANLSVSRPPAREAAAPLVRHASRNRLKTVSNPAAGVPGMVVTVQFPPGSAGLDDKQQLALYKLTREWRANPRVRLLWVRGGAGADEAGGQALARKRAEALRRATGGKGFPWERVWLDPAAETGAQGLITVIESR